MHRGMGYSERNMSSQSLKWEFGQRHPTRGFSLLRSLFHPCLWPEAQKSDLGSCCHSFPGPASRFLCTIRGNQKRLVISSYSRAARPNGQTDVSSLPWERHCDLSSVGLTCDLLEKFRKIFPVIKQMVSGYPVRKLLLV